MFFEELIYKVTKKCNNGKEIKIKKSVFVPCEIGKKIDQDRHDKAMNILKTEGFYDIKYIGTKYKKLLFTEKLVVY